MARTGEKPTKRVVIDIEGDSFSVNFEGDVTMLEVLCVFKEGYQAALKQIALDLDKMPTTMLQ